MIMDLSIIIPAYNEQKRLPPTLKRVLDFLHGHYHGTFEIIVVDDGSEDETSQSVELFIHQYPYVRLVRLGRNQGRGIAVREGISLSEGDLILEMDADGSVNEEAIVRFLEYMDAHSDISMLIGSRNIEGSRILCRQPLLRRALAGVFFTLAWMMFNWDFKDRVNGFKMFRKSTANDIFRHQQEIGFLAEAELVVIAEHREWKYELLPVLWTDNRDSRIKPLRESWRSFWGMFAIFKRVRCGAYDKKTF